MNTWSFFLSATQAESLGLTLLHSLWQGALIVLGIAIWLRLRPNSTAPMRYSLALAGILLLVAGMGLTYLLVQPETSQYVFGEPMVAGLLGEWQLLEMQAGAVIGMTWQQWVSLAWMLGTVAWAIRWIASWMYIQGLRYRQTRILPSRWQHQLNSLARKMGIRQTLLLLESPRVRMPMVVGHLKPVVLIPMGLLTGLNPQQLEAVLAHELAHIRRYDFAVNFLVRLLEIVLFYHPAYWWLQRMLDAERENACDDLAVAHSPGRRVYAEALVAVAAWRPAHGPNLAMGLIGGNRSTLMTRIQRIMLKKSDVKTAPLGLVLLLGVGLTLLGIWMPANNLMAESRNSDTFSSHMFPEWEAPITVIADRLEMPVFPATPKRRLQPVQRVNLRPYSFPQIVLNDTPPPPPCPISVQSRLRRTSPPPPPPIPAPSSPETERMAELFGSWVNTYIQESNSWAEEVERELTEEKMELERARLEVDRLRMELERAAAGQNRSYMEMDRSRLEAEMRRIEAELAREKAQLLLENRHVREEQAQRQAELEQVAKEQAEREMEKAMMMLEQASELQELRDHEGLMHDLQARIQEAKSRMQEAEVQMAKVQGEIENDFAEWKIMQKAFFEDLKVELKKDGLLGRKGKQVRITLEEDSIRIDGKRLPRDLEAKYMDIFQRAGFNMEGSSSLLFER